MSSLKSALYPIYYRIINKVRSSKQLARILFGMDIPPDISGPLWDFTTLVLKKGLDALILDGYKVLEVGVGRTGILLGSVSKHHRIQAIGLDIQDDCVKGSTRALAYNHIKDVEIRQSNLFSNVQDQFDIIFFNCPYAKTSWGEQFFPGFKSEFWDGGDSGNETMVRFLSEVPKHMTPGAKVLLGVNNFYMTHEEVLDVIKKSPLKLESRVGSRFNPSCAYVLS